MKYDVAKQQLDYALKHQKSIQIDKLKNILMSMNISLKKPQRDVEIEYLKGEIRKLKRRLKE